MCGAEKRSMGNLSWQIMTYDELTHALQLGGSLFSLGEGRPLFL